MVIKKRTVLKLPSFFHIFIFLNFLPAKYCTIQRMNNFVLHCCESAAQQPLWRSVNISIHCIILRASVSVIRKKSSSKFITLSAARNMHSPIFRMYATNPRIHRLFQGLQTVECLLHRWHNERHTLSFVCCDWIQHTFLFIYPHTNRQFVKRHYKISLAIPEFCIFNFLFKRSIHSISFDWCSSTLQSRSRNRLFAHVTIREFNASPACFSSYHFIHHILHFFPWARI